MESDVQQAILEHLEFLRLQLEFRLRGLFLPSRRIQWAYLAGGVLLALALRHWARPKLQAWRAALPARPEWRHLALVMLERRLGLVLFIAYAWALAGALRLATGSALSAHVVELVATIAGTMLLASLATRVIGNRLLRGLTKWALWIYIVLYFLRLDNTMRVFLLRLAVDVGEHRINALAVLQALVLLAAYLALARLLIRSISSRLRNNPHVSPSVQVLATKVLQVLLYGAACLVGLDAIGFDLTGLAVLTGAIGIGVGFGLQKVVSNLVSGVIILLDRSIKPGDVISLGDTFGWVEELTARYVSITTRTGKEYLIPNEDLITGQVVNWSHSNDFVRLDITFGTSYGDDWHRVREVAVEAAMSCERVLHDRQPVCHIVNFGDSAIEYVLRFWISDPSQGLTNIRGNVFVALLDAFQAEGISIPFPQREVRLLGEDVTHTGWQQR